MNRKLIPFVTLIVLPFAAFTQTNLSRPGNADSPTFPEDDYTPFGYLDNPWHSFVMNRSGIIRSVPPLGFGFWCRQLPWPYGEGAARPVNYLSFLTLGVHQGGTAFGTAEDFARVGVNLVSRYHTKNVMTYNWRFQELEYEIRYFHPVEHAILCQISIHNHAETNSRLVVHAIHTYGHQENRWWGSDGVTSRHDESAKAAVSKIWAYGDVFAMGADRGSSAYKATTSKEELAGWISRNDLSTNKGARSRFPDPVYAVQSYDIEVAAKGAASMTLALTRGKNEQSVLREHNEVLTKAPALLKDKQVEDSRFYRTVPLLSGDWPEAWRRGWIYDWETLRMNIRPPMGIYEHHWDAMQIFSPRAVLGETAIDAMCMSYADVDLAKEVMLGVFADAPMPNIPCSREDGSMNMIGADGRECGTAPIWGMPFLVIRSIYERDNDKSWLAELYPYLRRYLDWWLENRTDKEGWFHAANSWESGQDGSKRFLIPNHDPGAAADFVRTVDIEAAMAHALSTMRDFAEILGKPEDVAYWEKLTGPRIDNTRTMFVDGWFRDFDARSNNPIILEGYYDIMMLMPASLNIASEEQMQALPPMFYHFRDHPTHFLEWPSFLFPFTEAAWNSGLRLFNAEEVAKIGNRIYPRLDERQVQPILIGEYENRLPTEFSFRIPGVSDEFWPLSEENPGGCENYGWGATFPTLVIRNILGFREAPAKQGGGFYLAPALPENLTGLSLGIRNLNYRNSQLDVAYARSSGGGLEVRLVCRLDKPGVITIVADNNRMVTNSTVKKERHTLVFPTVNGSILRVMIQ